MRAVQQALGIVVVIAAYGILNQTTALLWYDGPNQPIYPSHSGMLRSGFRRVVFCPRLCRAGCEYHIAAKMGIVLLRLHRSCSYLQALRDPGLAKSGPTGVIRLALSYLGLGKRFETHPRFPKTVPPRSLPQSSNFFLSLQDATAGATRRWLRRRERRKRTLRFGL